MMKLKLSERDQKFLSKVYRLAEELDGPNGVDNLDELEIQELAWMLFQLVELVNKGYDK